MADVFISYSRHDNEFVDRLAHDLEQAGVGVFYDRNLLPGDSWADVLQKALDESDFVIAVLSANSAQSPWTAQEWMFALHQELSTRQTKLIPIRIDESPIPATLEQKYALDFRDYGKALPKLLEALKRPEKMGALPDKLSGPEAQDLADKIAPQLEAFKTKGTGTGSGTGTGGATFAGTGTGDGGLVVPKKCFMVMPFGVEALNIVYEEVIKPVAENECGLNVERGDDIFGSNPIMQDILESINSSQIVIADLTGKNANVFYEVGICHALNKNVLLMAQSIEDVPFDLRHRRVLIYEYSFRGAKRLEGKIKEHLHAMIPAAAAAAT